MARTLVGQRIRDHRKARGWTQAALASHVEISPSYLNLIESDRRSIAGALLKRIADALGQPVEEFDGAAERRLVDELGEIAADAALAPLQLTGESAADLVASHPGWARALVALHRIGRERQHAVEALSDRLGHDPFVGETVHSLLTNVTAIRSASEILESVAELDAAQRKRFISIIASESRRVTQVSQSIASFLAKAPPSGAARAPVDEVNDFLQDNANHFPALEAAAEALVRSVGAPAGRLAVTLEDWLGREHGKCVSADGASAASHQFALARAAAQAACGGAVAAELARTTLLATPAARKRAERVLFSYVAGAVVMPYATFQPAAELARYDADLLALRFGASFEQVCHRLTTLRRRGAEGVPFGFMRTDPAGFIDKRLALPGLPMPRYGNTCPLWAVHASFGASGTIVRQLVEFPAGDRFLMVARAVDKGTPVFGAAPRLLSVMVFCDALHADRTVYAAGLDIGVSAPAIPVGPCCRICSRAGCAWRQEGEPWARIS